MDPWEAYKAKFGEYPPIMGLGDTEEGLLANIKRAVEEGKPLWTYYFDEDPAESGIDL